MINIKKILTVDITCSRARSAIYNIMHVNIYTQLLKLLENNSHPFPHGYIGDHQLQVFFLENSHKCIIHMILQLLAASFRNCTFASPMPLNRFRRMNDLCRRKVGLGSGVVLFPAEESAATSMTSFTLRWESLEEISE